MTPKPSFGEHDADSFREGTHAHLHHYFGAHPTELDGASGCHFAVWAPNASEVAVIGDFNGWSTSESPLESDPGTGIWSGFVAGAEPGAHYKYYLRSKHGGYDVNKSDPFAFYREIPPETGSIIWEPRHHWTDAPWMEARAERDALDAPWSIYEIHLGSWRRPSSGALPSYRAIAIELAEYVSDLGFTHVELLPVMEHPYYPSWGYQTTGHFAPTSRYGAPEDFMYLVDVLHQHEVGVILDWVPSHFPSDAHGLGFFDGTYLYEHADPQKRIHPDWDSLEFNYGRGQVQSYLLSSAMYWLDHYHADALRVDAVASMLYLNYSREEGEWTPNRLGGHESLEAVEFIKRFNLAAYQRRGTHTIAEESTAWPLVSRPTDSGGLGFGMKWDLGFMHDTLDFFAEEPKHRRFHQRKVTFRTMYAFSENFVLPLSHDEVVHGKGSLLSKMRGKGSDQFANLRLLFGYMWGQPGKKLVFMGGEFGQRREWSHDESLEWFVLEHPDHLGIQRWLRDLNRLYRGEPSLHRGDFASSGFEWVNCDENGTSVMAFLRVSDERPVLVVCNFGDVARLDHRIGLPEDGAWQERLNSDSTHYGGNGEGNLGVVDAEAAPYDGQPFSVNLTLPALGVLYFTPARSATGVAAGRRRK